MNADSRHWIPERPVTHLSDGPAIPQTTRAPITAADTSKASPSSDAHERAPSASTIAGSCRPTSTKRSALTRNVKIPQNAFPESRTSGVVSSGVNQPT